MSVAEVRKKREFSGLPDSIAERALGLSKGDVKDARKLLRKYFGVFLTNKVLKGEGDLLKFHMSSRKRDYEKFYSEIFAEGDFRSVIDLGCGANGFSYGYLPRGVCYVGVEAVGQLVENTNRYFRENGFGKACVVQGDLFDLDFVLSVLKNAGKPRVVFMFQVVDALENLEKNFSKRFILEISKECEKIVLSLSTESLGGRKKFAVRRKWILDFLEENFLVERDFEIFGERIIILKNKK